MHFTKLFEKVSRRNRESEQLELIPSTNSVSYIFIYPDFNFDFEREMPILSFVLNECKKADNYPAFIVMDDEGSHIVKTYSDNNPEFERYYAPPYSVKYNYDPLFEQFKADFQNGKLGNIKGVILARVDRRNLKNAYKTRRILQNS